MEITSRGEWDSQRSSEVRTSSRTCRTGSAGSGSRFRQSGQRTGPDRTSAALIRTRMKISSCLWNLDAIKFVSVFRPPISQSTLHIYISALSFAPKYLQVAQHFVPLFLCLKTGKPDHWPAVISKKPDSLRTVCRSCNHGSIVEVPLVCIKL